LKLLLSLEGQALQDVITWTHLRANGVALLHELLQTYKPKNVPEVIAAKIGEFWSRLKRKPTETVVASYNRFHELLEDISGAEDTILTKSATCHYIFTLGSEFEPIQHQHCIGNLPSDWNTTYWPTLLVLCRDFYNSVNLSGFLSKDGPPDATSDKTNQHRKKVKQWFLFPSKFCQEIA
jgi:hypothetical protein